MKKNAKKLAAVLGVVTCAFTMSVIPAFAESAAPAATDGTTSDLPQGVTSDNQQLYGEAYTLLSYVDQLYKAGLSEGDADFDNMMNVLGAYYNCDPAVVSNAYDTWTESAANLGDYDIQNEYPVLASCETNSEGVEVIDLTVDGDKHDAEFIVYLDPSMEYSSTSGVSQIYTLTSVAVNVDYSMGEKMEQAGLNTVLGMGTTFVVLILLAFLISLFRFIPKIQAAFAKKNEPEEEEAAPTAAEIAGEAAPAEENFADDGELVAVIAAAIAASEGAATTDGFVVRSIRKSRKRW